MLRKIRATGLIIGMTLLMGGFLVPMNASAQLFDSAKDSACDALNSTSGAAGSNSCGTNSGGRVDGIIETIINVLSVVIGVVAVIMIIIAGLKYITSQGESASVSSAKDTLLYAIVGLVIVAFAQTIVKFVLKRVI